MPDTSLLHELIEASAELTPQAIALSAGHEHLSYAQLHTSVIGLCNGLLALELKRADRVAVYLEKRQEFVVSCFASSAAGLVFVPINPVLKADQVGHVVRDCGATVLITSAERLEGLSSSLATCPELRHVILTGGGTPASSAGSVSAAAQSMHDFADLLSAPAQGRHRTIDTDMLAILYTSGSTGRPKGVVLSHRNMVAGAKSVASYLGNHRGDTVRRDAQGFLYFIGRRDEMMKTSGYRVSPTEVEEVLYATRLVGECVAFGVDHPVLGQAIQVIATAPDGTATVAVEPLLTECRRLMPAFMVPHGVESAAGPLPRNANGKIDRKLLAAAWIERHEALASRP